MTEVSGMMMQTSFFCLEGTWPHDQVAGLFQSQGDARVHAGFVRQVTARAWAATKHRKTPRLSLLINPPPGPGPAFCPARMVVVPRRPPACLARRQTVIKGLPGAED